MFKGVIMDAMSMGGQESRETLAVGEIVIHANVSVSFILE
jgi:hypothetical protein